MMFNGDDIFSDTKGCSIMATMQAIRLTGPCSTKELVPTTVEKPTIKPGYVLIKVKAFGVNESEITSRKGGPRRTSAIPASSVSRAQAKLLR